MASALPLRRGRCRPVRTSEGIVEFKEYFSQLAVACRVEWEPAFLHIPGTLANVASASPMQSAQGNTECYNTNSEHGL